MSGMSLNPLVALACTWAIAFSGANATAAAGDGTAAHALLEQTNALRVEAGAGAVVPEARLTAAAVRFAAYMADTGRYGHDADGRQPVDRVREQGYAHCLVAENIAFAHSDRGFDAEALATRVFDGWSQSPPHRRNMLDADMTEVGIATVQSRRDGRHYAVQVFGRPRSLAVRISLANRSRDTVRYELAGEPHELKPGVTRTHEHCRHALLALKDAGLDGRAAKPVLTTADARYRIDDTNDGVRLNRE
jgi:uncharacterized protein YkwD